MGYISAKLYRKMIRCALAEGLDPGVLYQLPTTPAGAETVQVVPSDHFFLLHETLEQKLGPGFATRTGQQMKIEDYGVLGLSWRTCSRAGEIFDRFERYFKLLSNTYLFEVAKQTDISRIYLHRQARRRGVELSNEATFAATVVMLRAMTETAIAPVEVAFAHRQPCDLRSHRQLYQCPLSFNQPRNFIAYQTADLETRTAKADASINRFLLERVEEETRKIEISTGTIALEVEALVKDALPGGIPAIARIGEHMGMSSRTLTRRLAENGLTFRDIIKKAQEETATEMLKNSDSSIAEIAFQTGFSEQSAFNRAFKRWTGQSPVAFRKKY